MLKMSENLSNKTCGECRFYIQETSHCKLKGVGWKFATDSPCSGFTPKESTVFETITQSEETLAEKLVIMIAYFHRRSEVKWFWRSTIAEGKWGTKEEAIATTVAKLKEVCDE
jgi:hypothetical protein